MWKDRIKHLISILPALHNHCLAICIAIVTVHQNKYERLGCGDYAHWDSSVLFDESKEVFFNYEL
jgi:hypothetical protein